LVTMLLIGWGCDVYKKQACFAANFSLPEAVAYRLTVSLSTGLAE